MAALEKLFKESYRPTDQRKCVGNYVIGSILGQGRSSLVRRGVDVTNGHQVAIKTIARTAGNKGRQRERQFRQETEVLVRVRHPHIVKLIELLETSRYLYAVMELVPGCTLRTVLNDRSFFPEEDVRLMIRQLAGALHHLHTADVVHRDVKPENVMISETHGQLTLIDLGLSGSLTGGQTKGQCGSPAYMAPELLRGQLHGPPVDMWSLGVLLHELLAGHVPFRPERGCRQAIHNMTAVYSQIIKSACRDICDGLAISPEGADFLRGLIRMDEKKRTSSLEVVNHPWLAR